MIFAPGNCYKYGQDFCQRTGLPAGVDFLVRPFPTGGSPGMFVLEADGYGSFEPFQRYGCGKLYVWGLTAEQRKLFDAAAKEQRHVKRSQTAASVRRLRQQASALGYKLVKERT